MREDAMSGLSIRRRVLGDEYVDQAVARVDKFNAPIQEFLNEQVWGGIWSRGQLPLKTRSLAVVSMLIALNRPKELGVHLRAAIRNGCAVEELREIILQAAAYCGAPAAVEAARVANDVLAPEIEALGESE